MSNVSILAAAAALLLSLGQVAFAAQADGAAPAQPAAQSEQEKEKQEQEKRDKEAEARLLAVGQVAPDFTLPLAGGGEVTLANLLKFGKAVLVGFWAIDEKRGGAEMEKLQKLHEEFESKGLTTIMINPADSVDDVKKFADGKLHFQVAIDGKETNRAVTGVYRARLLPTYYLLDPDGKVLWRSIRLKEPGLRETLTKAGVK